MLLNLSQIGQIALPVGDVDRAEAFYEKVVGLRKLYRFGNLSFFDCAGVRLLLDKLEGPGPVTPQGCIYFRCADIALAVERTDQARRIVRVQAASDREDGRPRSLHGVLHRSRRPHARADAGSAEGICAGGLKLPTAA